MSDTETIEASPVEASPVAALARDETPTPTADQLDRLFGPEPGSEKKPEPQTKAETQEQPAEKVDPQEPDAEFDTAFQDLLKAGVPPSVLKNAKRADLVRWSQTEAKRAADIQSAFQERSDLKKRVDELSKTATAKPSEPSSGVPTETADLSDIYAPLADALGPDMEKPFASFAEKLIAKAEARVEAKYAKRFGEMSVGTMATRELLIEQARAQLRDSFPELDDDTKLGQVVEKMGVLAATGAYSSAPTVRAGARSCMEDACGLIFKPKPGADPKKQSISRARDNGQPIVKSNNSPPKALSQEEVARRKFLAREEGATDEEVARIR
jgi:hypothetical protein